jgi:signal peptidase II
VLYILATGSLLLLLDQWSKRAVESRARGRRVCAGPGFQIRYVATSRDVYRRAGGRTALTLGWAAALLSAIVLHHGGLWFQSPVALIGLGLALGGAAGNLLDILRSRHVIDFIDLRWWPVFNLADMGIVAGLMLALVPSLSRA